MLASKRNSNSKIVAAGVGNTSLQFGRFTLDDIRSQALPTPDQHHVFPVVDGVPEFAEISNADHPEWYVASVNPPAAAELQRWAQQHLGGESFHLLEHQDFPIALDVETPTKVGRDRLAAAVAANHLREPDRATIFIDAGTALTVNLINDAGRFQGGAILPGAGISLEMLNQKTQQLPQLEYEMELLHPHDPPLPIGKNTRDAIRAGVYWGLVGAVRELVRRISADHQDPQLFVTGGFGECLATQLGSAYEFIPHLVLAGVALAVHAQQ